MTVETKQKLDWSDALFSCVYLWVVGKPIMSEDASAAMQRHDPLSPLGGLAIRMRALSVGGGVTPEWLTENGYFSSRNPDKAREKWEDVILEFIGRSDLNDALSDSKRINHLFPPVASSVAQIDRRKLGDGTTVSGDDVDKLEGLNTTYTHVLAFGDHHVVSMRANPVTGETHAFQTLNSFRNNFLDVGRVAGRKLGEAWLQWPGHAKRLDGVGFYPNPSLCPPRVYNLFSGLSVTPEHGECAPYLDHLRDVICAGHDEAYKYLVGGWRIYSKSQRKSPLLPW